MIRTLRWVKSESAGVFKICSFLCSSHCFTLSTFIILLNLLNKGEFGLFGFQGGQIWGGTSPLHSRHAASKCWWVARQTGLSSSIFAEWWTNNQFIWLSFAILFIIICIFCLISRLEFFYSFFTLVESADLRDCTLPLSNARFWTSNENGRWSIYN